MDIFEEKSASPMLIAKMEEPFDASDWIYELKLDGERCLAYLDQEGTYLQNKRKLSLNPRFPELINIHQNIGCRCILDGELAVLVEGKPDFSKVQRRSLMSNKMKIDIYSERYPAVFTAFDILYYEDHLVTELPLMERKTLLQKAVLQENNRFAVSRSVERQGTALYEAAKKEDLEGVVAKRRDSYYYMGKRTKDWIKFKNLMDDDYVILGYKRKENGRASLILGQYENGTMKECAHVPVSIRQNDFKIISSQPVKSQEAGTVWIQPSLVCAVKFMAKAAGGGLRQPVYKGLRDDKEPKECVASPS